MLVAETRRHTDRPDDAGDCLAMEQSSLQPEQQAIVTKQTILICGGKECSAGRDFYGAQASRREWDEPDAVRGPKARRE